MVFACTVLFHVVHCLRLRGGGSQALGSEAVEEIEALKSIFGDEMTSVVHEHSLSCRILLAGHLKGREQVALQITCDSRYPDDLPTIEIIGETDQSLSLTEELLKEAQQQRGQAMIFL